MNITDNLIRIKEGKDNIIKSLKNKGVSIADNTLINEIPTIIDNAEIGGGGDTPVQPETPELIQKYEGATVFRIEIENNNTIFYLSLNYTSKSTCNIDWGDGKIEENVSVGWNTHTYNKGIYDINVFGISSNIKLENYYGEYNNSTYTTYYSIFKNPFLKNHKYLKNIKNILIGYNITSIGSSAFSSCSSLQTITIPESVTSIGSSAFSSCSSLQSISIPESVTSIGSDAFQSCSSLQSISIPESVTSIGSSTFYNCSSLQTITIPESVTSIGSSAFYNCSNLYNIVCKSLVAPTLQSNSFNSTNKGNLYTKNEASGYDEGYWKTTLLDKGFIKKDISEILENIPTEFYLQVKYPKYEIFMPEYIGEAKLIEKNIDENGNCEYKYDNYFDVLPNKIFDNQDNLLSIVIPENVKILGEYCISNIEITLLELPSTLKSLNNYSLYNCYYLSTITCKSEVPPTLQSNSIMNVGSQVPSGTKKVLRVPEGSDYSAWKSKLSGFTIEYIPLSEL